MLLINNGVNMKNTVGLVLPLITIFFPMVHLEETKFRVIIVGAGASGIAAATKLLENDIDNFLILEGENRIGGRIHSEQLGQENVFIDLGAEFCEGQVGNIVYRLARHYNILKPTDFSFDLIYSNGSTFNNHGLVRELLGFKNFLKYEQITKREELMSYGEFFLEHFDNELLERYSYDHDTLKLCLDTLSILEGEKLLKDGAFSWMKPALLTNKEICEGEQYLNWNGAGFRTIIDLMIKVFPEPANILRIDDKFQLNKVVSTIEYGGFSDNNVTLLCEDGTNYTAEFVIFTPSVGVLKERHHRLFIPELPIKHILCIDSLGFESYMKIILQFEERWWPKTFKGKALVWSAEDKTNLPYDFGEGPVLNGESWLSDIRFIFPVAAAPNFLAVYMTGKFVEEIEQAPENTILDGVMFVLYKFLGREMRIGRLRSMWHTNWYTNPNFRGMRSFETLGSTSFHFNCNEELSKPLRNLNDEPVVLFAGEATSTDHYGTVHGAIESGYREANKLLNYLKRKKLYQFLKY